MDAPKKNCKLPNYRMLPTAMDASKKQMYAPKLQDTVLNNECSKTKCILQNYRMLPTAMDASKKQRYAPKLQDTVLNKQM
jgi:hypothetical protein